LFKEPPISCTSFWDEPRNRSYFCPNMPKPSIKAQQIRQEWYHICGQTQRKVLTHAGSKCLKSAHPWSDLSLSVSPSSASFLLTVTSWQLLFSGLGIPPTRTPW
jgi:hypothetical protein